MKFAVTTLLLLAIAGCSGMPPKPPKCVGEFRPINPVSQDAKADQVANLCTHGGEHAQS